MVYVSKYVFIYGWDRILIKILILDLKFDFICLQDLNCMDNDYIVFIFFIFGFNLEVRGKRNGIKLILCIFIYYKNYRFDIKF